MTDNTLRVSLITPTYNEREEHTYPRRGNLLCNRIRARYRCGVIVVDDNSPDGTGEVAEGLKDTYPLQVVHRAGKLGLGSAVMEGFALSDREYIGVIDADLSHDPSILPQLIHGLREYDITIGSRFGETSKVEKWALHRRLTSLTGVGFARLLTGVEDPLSGSPFSCREEDSATRVDLFWV